MNGYPTIIEYKVINTLEEGVPLSIKPSLLAEQWRKAGDLTEMTYAEQLAAGLTELNVEGGWELCGVMNQLLIFKRKKYLPTPSWNS